MAWKLKSPSSLSLEVSTCKMRARAASSGTPSAISRSKRPALLSAGSKESGRLVAPITITCPGRAEWPPSPGACGEARWEGRQVAKLQALTAPRAIPPVTANHVVPGRQLPDGYAREDLVRMATADSEGIKLNRTSEGACFVDNHIHGAAQRIPMVSIGTSRARQPDSAVVCAVLQY